MSRTTRLVLPLLASLFVAAPVAAQIPAAEFAARRSALLDSLSDGVVLVLGGGEPVQDYLPFIQSRPFFYLTGFLEPEAALVMVKQGGQRRELIFVRERDAAREVWNGVRVGTAGARSRLAIDGRDIGQLGGVLDSLLRQHATIHVLGDLGGGVHERLPHSQFVDALRASHSGLTVNDAKRTLDRMRSRKSAAELDRLRVAAEISARGHLAAWRLVQPGVAEFELQAAAEGSWRAEGGDGPSYGSIVGSGPNSTTLHYNRDDRVAQEGEVIVMDLASYFDGYAADITRTVPVSGRFSPAQRELYAIVLAAQKSAERQVRVGALGRTMSDSASAVLATGLASVGLIDSPSATYDCGSATQPRQCSQLSLFYMHGLGHGIGLDVHDPEQYALGGRIDVGSAFTIEPGIYVRANLLEVIPWSPRNDALKSRIRSTVEKFANIGVRIEDDYLVTEQGVVRVTAGVPRELDEVERELAKPRTPHDAEAVARYLRYKTGR